MDSGIVKQAGCNKQAGWKFFVKQLSKQDLIRASRVEENFKIVKRACSFIRYLRVGKRKSKPQSRHPKDSK